MSCSTSFCDAPTSWGSLRSHTWRSFGLASYVYTSDGAKAKMMSQQLNAGLVGINHPFVSMPEGLEAFLRTKFVTEVGV
jgi:acyl-CoA reductase-like NAD-dependent aldehyde dehydrogenase